jgi:tetratricopeptide (TPR) repeat protein
MCAFEVPVSVAVPSLGDRIGSGDSAGLCPPPPYEQPSIPPKPTPEEARKAFRESLRLAAHGRPVEALLHLRVVEVAYPDLQDRLALREGQLLLEAGNALGACEAFAKAARSPESTTRAHAYVGEVRCRIEAGDPKAAQALQQLQRSLPEVPVTQLRFELARAEERQGNGKAAARLYRQIDLDDPSSGVAARARARLEALAREGVPIPPLSNEARVERLERLLWGAPPAKVREGLAELEGVRLTADLEARVALVSARIAKVEGRWEDARRQLERARFKATLASTVDAGAANASAQDMRNALQAREQDAARKDIAKLKGPRLYRTLPLHRLLRILDMAVAPGLTDVTDEVLDALKRKGAPGSIQLDAAILAAGTASDEVLAGVLEGLTGRSRAGVMARYHYARTLERLGRWAEAEVQHLRVIDDDNDDLHYYRMWSEVRLREVREALVGHCAPGEARLVGSTSLDDAELAACVADGLVGADNARRRSAASAPGRSSTAMREPSPRSLAARLAPIAHEWGGPFPWIERAMHLLELGDRQSAADELHEAFLAWREALGRPIRRVGLLGVYRHGDLPRQQASWQDLRQRRSLDVASRHTLSQVASEMGDVGVAVGFGGFARASDRPRPHAALVERAAQRHGVDPNLLFAVMRVESVYQRRIISYAGAVGLMQIMPRTGKLIAGQLDRADFSTEHLLDAATNIDFAAWYLASLIERFDGRVPLAIASYNGGPHNVRRWLQGHAVDMPLEAFLERIPFTQTHRYVRRVLTHYAAYRAQEGRPMTPLHVELPRLDAPDPIGF